MIERGKTSVLFLALLIVILAGFTFSQQQFPEPKIPFAPRHYICYRADKPLNIDGKLNDPSWQQTAWTEDFQDIEGSLKPLPRLRTRAKLLWDDKYLYVGAELEEPDVWGTLTQRDSIIYQDNDFEVFIDPDNDTQNYYELEINALGTEWDLLLTKPYRDNGIPISCWDIQGLRTMVYVDGSLNLPGTPDRGWSVEMAIPWETLKESASEKRKPQAGEQWRVNFSRVEYQLEPGVGTYQKKVDPKTNKPFPENNWVWSPQGLINMHYPEMWGFLQFSEKKAGSGTDEFTQRPDENARWVLRKIYYGQKNYFLNHDRYAGSLKELGLTLEKVPGFSWPLQIRSTWMLFEAQIKKSDNSGTMVLYQDGYVGEIKNK